LAIEAHRDRPANERRQLHLTAAEIAHDIVTVLAGGPVSSEGTPKKRPQGAGLLFAEARAIVNDYLERRVDLSSRRAHIEDVAMPCYREVIVERLTEAIQVDDEQGEPALLPRIDPTRPLGFIADLRFETEKPTRRTVKSHLSRVVVDGKWRDSAPFH